VFKKKSPSTPLFDVGLVGPLRTPLPFLPLQMTLLLVTSEGSSTPLLFVSTPAFTETPPLGQFTVGLVATSSVTFNKLLELEPPLPPQAVRSTTKLKQIIE
jgi:hypothetical protein